MTGGHRAEVVMAFHPTARGFGWVCFEAPKAPLDWGLAYVRGDKNTKCLQQVRVLFERFRPTTLVLERFDRRTGRRASRVVHLCQAVEALAGEFGIEVRTFSRHNIRKAFGLQSASTRQDVAERLAQHIRAFSHRLPRERRPWDSLDRRMALFSAAALALTYYAD